MRPSDKVTASPSVLGFWNQQLEHEEDDCGGGGGGGGGVQDRKRADIEEE